MSAGPCWGIFWGQNPIELAAQDGEDDFNGMLHGCVWLSLLVSAPWVITIIAVVTTCSRPTIDIVLCCHQVPPLGYVCCAPCLVGGIYNEVLQPSQTVMISFSSINLVLVQVALNVHGTAPQQNCSHWVLHASSCRLLGMPCAIGVPCCCFPCALRQIKREELHRGSSRY